MDVSEKNINIYVLPANKDDGVEFKISNDIGEINSFIDGMEEYKYKQRTIVMETRTPSQWMAELFERRGCKVLVGNARKLRMTWKDDSKCNERDAEILARMAKFDPKLLYPVKHDRHQVRVDLAVVKSRDFHEDTNKKLSLEKLFLIFWTVFFRFRVETFPVNTYNNNMKRFN